MDFNKIPFIRDNKWIITPVVYVSFLAILSILFLYKNASHEYVDYNQKVILGLELNQKHPEIAEKLKYPLDSKEFAIISKIINIKSFKLARDSELSLLQNANVAGIYAFNSEYKILALGYMSNNAEDCRKLRAITISKLGKHLMLIEDSSLSEQLSWKSQDNLYTFFNQFSSDGIDLESVCGYMISSK